jgi:predicted nucleotidyltransferase
MQPDREQLDDLLRRICGVVQPVRVILFGSAARGEMGPDSDLDVLVVVSDNVDKRSVTQRIYRELIGFGAAADVIVATEGDIDRYGSNFSLVYYPALRDGREIYAG